MSADYKKSSLDLVKTNRQLAKTSDGVSSDLMISNKKVSAEFMKNKNSMPSMTVDPSTMTSLRQPNLAVDDLPTMMPEDPVVPIVPQQPKRELTLVSRSTYLKERGLQCLFFGCAFLAVVVVILIFAFTIKEALPVFTDIGLTNFFGFTWAPTEGKFGIASLAAGSALVTAGALVMGVPLGVGTAVYLTEIASERIRRFISPAVDLLAGVPSVIYGFFGMVIIRPFIAQITGGLGFGALTAWFVLAIMIVPTITTLTMDALNSIPMGIREASYAMGATKWQTIYKVVLPAAKLGIVDAVVLGMGRAIGETMAVLMVVGNAPVIPASVASPISTLTSQIALDMSYSSGLHRTALFGMGVVLFIISGCLVGIVRLLTKIRRNK